MRFARTFAVPRWTERAVLLAVGTWLVAYALTQCLEVVNRAGGLLLPSIPTGPHSWRPAEPLGDLPYDLQRPLLFASGLLLAAPLLYGLAAWPDPTRRRRFLLILACIDLLLVVVTYQALTAPAVREPWQTMALAQAPAVPLVAMCLVAAWPSRRARQLGIAGAVLLAGSYAYVHLAEARLIPLSWYATPAQGAALHLGQLTARALSGGFIGAGLILASKPKQRAASPEPPAGARA